MEEEQIVDFGGVRINDPVKLLQLRPPLQRMSQEASLNFVRAMKSTEGVSNGEEGKRKHFFVNLEVQEFPNWNVWSNSTA